MQFFEFPRGAVREYIAAIDIAAVMVMRVGDRVVVKATRDPEKTLAAMPDAFPISAWWVRNREIATAVAKAARNDVGPWLDALIQTEAQARGSVAVAHASAMERIRSAGAQIDAAVEAANGRGELAWFNRAYRAYREAGGRLAYQAARARLRRAVVRRLVISGGIEFGADLLPEVFGEGR